MQLPNELVRRDNLEDELGQSLLRERTWEYPGLSWIDWRIRSNVKSDIVRKPKTSTAFLNAH
jgi:hypothetical protein